MGKRYYCDYCDKTMVSTPTVVKTHNKGVVHQKIVNEHYQQFKDPETILKEESVKKPCTRNMRGECQFGAICRYSHYSREQIQELQRYVESKNKQQSSIQPSFEDLYHRLQDEKTNKQTNSDSTNTIIYDPNGISHVLPWTYPMKDELLPPSLRQLKAEDFADVTFVEWGINREERRKKVAENAKRKTEIKDLNENINIKKYLKQISRQEKDEERRKKLVAEQHANRIAEINDFMENHHMTTIYLLEEVRRIKNTRMIKDDLREMVSFLEKPENEILKDMVIKCYEKYRKPWDIKNRIREPLKINNLVINTLKDPFNDGVN